MPGPLSHLRVLDVSRILAGPSATQMLSDLGAEVIKIERPGAGDDTRHWGPPYLKDRDGNDTADSTYYLSINRGKRSVTVDISKPEGQKIVRDLAAKSDIFVENYKVGGLAKYGLTYDDLKAVNPSLIYCSITGFGQDGPYATRAGYDYMIQAMGGMMSITGEADERPGGGPMRVGIAIADLTTGLYSTVAILAAVAHRERTGEGQYIDMALLDCATAILTNQGLNYLNTGTPPGRVGNRHPNVVPYQPFPSADGHVVIAVGNDGQFRRLCQVLGLPELADDERFATNSARVTRQPELAELLAVPVKEKTTAEWLEILEAEGVPCGPINSIEEVFNDPQIKHRGMVVEQEHALAGDIPMIASPINLSATPVEYQGAPPTLGQHTDDVLAEVLELSETRIAELRSDGVL